ncbi:MAG TPA: YkyB family protein [Bacillota bacterium]|nr:YkyB family protein [Bacillota bacterium]
MTTDLSTKSIAQAIFIINKHAKTAPEPKHLYTIKKRAINKLLKEKRCKKIGLHFSNHPKLSHQHSTLLVKVDNYYFHILPKRHDFKTLDHLGKLADTYRNPPTRMALSKAKQIVYKYINWKPNVSKKKATNQSSYFIPSSLGKFSWNESKKYRH